MLVPAWWPKDGCTLPLGSEDPRAAEWRDIAPVIAEICSDAADVSAEAVSQAGEMRDPKAVNALSEALRRSGGGPQHTGAKAR